MSIRESSRVRNRRLVSTAPAFRRGVLHLVGQERLELGSSMSNDHLVQVAGCWAAGSRAGAGARAPTRRQTQMVRASRRCAGSLRRRLGGATVEVQLEVLLDDWDHESHGLEIWAVVEDRKQKVIFVQDKLRLMS